MMCRKKRVNKSNLHFTCRRRSPNATKDNRPYCLHFEHKYGFEKPMFKEPKTAVETRERAFWIAAVMTHLKLICQIVLSISGQFVDQPIVLFYSHHSLHFD